MRTTTVRLDLVVISASRGLPVSGIGVECSCAPNDGKNAKAARASPERLFWAGCSEQGVVLCHWCCFHAVAFRVVCGGLDRVSMDRRVAEAGQACSWQLQYPKQSATL